LVTWYLSKYTALRVLIAICNVYVYILNRALVRFLAMSRTIDEVRSEFKQTGISVSAWAQARGYSVPLVYGVLSGRRPGTRGQSHNIAVALGLKPGRIGRLDELSFEQAAAGGNP